MAYRNTAQIAGISVAVVATGIIGYVAYFDHMRRNNPDFRKGIRTSAVKPLSSGSELTCLRSCDVGKQHKKVQAAAEARSKAEKDRNSKVSLTLIIEFADRPSCSFALLAIVLSLVMSFYIMPSICLPGASRRIEGDPVGIPTDSPRTAGSFLPGTGRRGGEARCNG